MSGILHGLLGSYRRGDPFWASTVLLLPGSGGVNDGSNHTFLDSSANNFTVARSGNASQGTFSPFAAPAPYSAATRGGSLYLDGSGDSVSVANAAALTPTNDFTIEFWAYLTSTTGVRLLYSKGYGIQVYISSSACGAAFSSSNSASYYLNTSFGTPATNTWQHVAVYRVGNNYYGALNGVVTLLGTSSAAPNTGTDVVKVGDWSVSDVYPVAGYMAGVRYVNGTALYGASNFTPPTAPPTAVANTQLLLNFTNASIPDATMLNVAETVPFAYTLTALSKWGGSAIRFDANAANTVNASGLVLPASTRWEFTGDFTVEGWVYPEVASGVRCMFATNNTDQALTWSNLGAGTSQLRFMTSVLPDPLTSTASILVDAWTHLAISRQGTTFRAFVNGAQVYSGTLSGTIGSNSPLYIGRRPDGSAAAIARMNDFRITNGVARYTAAFQPPIGPLQTS